MQSGNGSCSTYILLIPERPCELSAQPVYCTLWEKQHRHKKNESTATAYGFRDDECALLEKRGKAVLGTYGYW